MTILEILEVHHRIQTRLPIFR